jgi:hypothetical protein
MPNIEAHTKAWLFFAAALAAGEGQPASLQVISSHADVIDHNVPTERELADTLPLLEQQGLLLCQNAKYLLTPQGKILYQRASASSANIYATFNKLVVAFASASSGL